MGIVRASHDSCNNAVRRVDGADGPHFNGPGRWLFATRPYLIHDRDPLSTRVFGEILEGGGVQPIRLPPKSPNLNADAERFVRSMKEECLSRVRPPRRRARASPRGRGRRPRPS